MLNVLDILAVFSQQPHDDDDEKTIYKSRSENKEQTITKLYYV